MGFISLCGKKYYDIGDVERKPLLCQQFGCIHNADEIVTFFHRDSTTIPTDFYLCHVCAALIEAAQNKDAKGE